MRKIKMTFSHLFALSETINELSNDLHMRYLELSTILESIETGHTWVGKDEASYYRLLKEKYLNSLEKLNHTLNEYSIFLEKSGKTKEGLEQDMASKKISIC